MYMQTQKQRDEIKQNEKVRERNEMICRLLLLLFELILYNEIMQF